MASIPPLLPHQEDVLLSILESAERHNPRPSLLEVLKSYEQLLPRFGLDPSNDTFFYRYLLRLSLNPSMSWWQKLHDELQVGH
jgi:hypothetical protein